MNRIVFKSGGGNTHNKNPALTLLQLADNISLAKYQGVEKILVLSAFKGMTNLLGRAADALDSGDENEFDRLVKEFYQFHHKIAEFLFPKSLAEVFEDFNALISIGSLSMPLKIKNSPKEARRDYILSMGELAASYFTRTYFTQRKIRHTYVDVREVVCTDTKFGESSVLKGPTAERFQAYIASEAGEGNLVITEGFIGTHFGRFGGPLLTTTLGKEGSDYSAALFAKMFKADLVVFWKTFSSNGAPRIKGNLSFSEFLTSSNKVLDPRAVKLLEEAGILAEIVEFWSPTEGSPAILLPEKITV